MAGLGLPCPIHRASTSVLGASVTAVVSMLGHSGLLYPFLGPLSVLSQSQVGAVSPFMTGLEVTQRHSCYTVRRAVTDQEV